jgi:hypothetical protein
MNRDFVKHICLVLFFGMANLNVKVIAESRDQSFYNEIFHQSPPGFQLTPIFKRLFSLLKSFVKVRGLE